MSSPFGGVCVVGVGLTRQARRLEISTLEACVAAATLALDDAGIPLADVDGIAARWPGPGGTVFHPGSVDWASVLDVHPTWVGDTYPQGVPALLDAAAAIVTGQCSTVLITGGQASSLSGDAVASYTRPDNEFVAPWGSFTAAQFALVARRYLHTFDVAWEDIADVAATIRSAGSRNPEAVMYGRGEFTVEDIVSAPMIASPFTRLDLCLANEGAAAIVVTSAERARDCAQQPIELLGGGCEWYRQQYVDPPRYEEVGMIGSAAAKRSYAMAGVAPQDVDVAELYDVNSFEVIRQLEALGFCAQGEGASFVAEVGIGLRGGLPVNTDGGLMSFSHIGWGAPTLKIIECVRQLRGDTGDRQVPGAEVAVATGAGSGAQYHNVALFGRPRW